MGLGKSKILSQGASGIVAADNFAPILYTGNGGTQSINTVGFQPDLVWLKARNGTGQPTLFDSVRGVSELLESNSNAAEQNVAGYGVTAFNNDGFTVVDNSNGDYRVNGGAGGTYSGNPPNYVSWCFKASAAAVSNTNGTIASSVSANAGFSIVKYTATGTTATVGHGLSSAPELILSKTASAAYDWLVYAAPVGATKQMRLNATTGANTSGFMNNTAPTSSVYTVASGNNLNYANGDVNVAYCFTSISGYQKVGSYTGNSGTNSITTGFQPRFVMMKNTANGYSWIVQDSARGTGVILYPNLTNSDASTSTHITSFDSNGFTLGSNADVNYSGDTYIYLAIA